MGFGSLSGIGKQVTGSVSGFRQVLETNPGSLSFLMPPQVALGLQVAGTAGNLLGLHVPTADELTKLATGQLDLILKGARREVLSGLSKAQTGPLSSLGSPEEILQRIEWLL